MVKENEEAKKMRAAAVAALAHFLEGKGKNERSEAQGTGVSRWALAGRRELMEKNKKLNHR
ncbi:MAG: hypothetical protein AB1546_10330 [bacterium]